MQASYIVAGYGGWKCVRTSLMAVEWGVRRVAYVLFNLSRGLLLLRFGC